MAEFEELLKESFEIDTPSEGTVVKGRVIAVEAGQAIIDVGYKMEGRVDIKEFALPGEQASVLAFLPFSHVYGLMIQIMCVRGGGLLGHEPDLSETALIAALQYFRPTYLYAVPSLFEKIYKTFLRKSREAGRGALFERAAGTARDYAEARERRRLGRRVRGSDRSPSRQSGTRALRPAPPSRP